MGVPVGTIEFILIRSLYGGTRGYYRNYSDTEVPVGTTKLILIVFRILFLYYRAYTCLTDRILVLRSLFLYFGSYTCITELILVLRNLYLCYRAYSCISDLILVLRSIYWSYGSYTCVTDLILILPIWKYP